jgi:1-acyl-sn-glycerol-3-phosphate acyltransferase
MTASNEPSVTVLSPLGEQPKAFQAIYPALRRGVRLFCKAGFWLRGHGAEVSIPKTGAVLLYGNHTGWLDTLFLMATVDRPIRFMARDDIFAWPIVGNLLRQTRMIEVCPTKPRQSLRMALTALAQGEVVCIFPEGEITPTGRMQRFRPGISWIIQQAQRSAIDFSLVAFALDGGYTAWPHGRAYPKPCRVRVTYDMVSISTQPDVESLTDRLQAQVVALMQAA